MSMTFPGESEEYRTARDRLLAEEIELRRAMEAVAVARRALPPGGPVPQDYSFDGLGPGGAPAEVRLSELFAPGKDSLVIYNFMFPRHPRDARPGPTEGTTADLKLEEGPCPSCVALLDQLDGAAAHVEGAGFNLVVIAQAPLDRLLAFARERGWRSLRLLSSAGNSFKRDYHAETPEGHQMPMLNRIPPRRRRDPPLLELRDALRPLRSGPRPAPRGHAGAALEHHRLDSRGSALRLGGAAPLWVPRFSACVVPSPLSGIYFAGHGTLLGTRG